jgi:hypothetical protein
MSPPKVKPGLMCVPPPGIVCWGEVLLPFLQTEKPPAYTGGPPNIRCVCCSLLPGSKPVVPGCHWQLACPCRGLETASSH